jgi:hypothetical protein
MRDLRGPLLRGDARLAIVRVDPEDEPSRFQAPTIKRSPTGRGYYVYRDERGRFRSKEEWQAARSGRGAPGRRPSRQESPMDWGDPQSFGYDEYDYFDEGDELEVSVSYKETT